MSTGIAEQAVVQPDDRLRVCLHLIHSNHPYFSSEILNPVNQKNSSSYPSRFIFMSSSLTESDTHLTHVVIVQKGVENKKTVFTLEEKNYLFDGRVCRRQLPREAAACMRDKGRVCCLNGSAALAVVALALLTVCLFSASFRHNSDNNKGTKYYGLIRFCYEPPIDQQSRDDDSNSKTCHLRNYIRSAQCEDTKGQLKESKSTRNCFGDFELASVILIAIAMGCCLLSLVFTIWTIFTSFGALANSVVLLAAAISSLSAFLTYTYYYELKENQSEIIAGYQYLIHYGWAYYLLGSSAAILIVAFVCSVFGSAFVLVSKSRKRKSKVQSISL
ncbi:unnamed protein product [Caenorhabditis auriculariae]|uniref:Uncharacterized protein n=1 Tax=Caenorhabditis auriculariae TaxID=2777116 RepID=A0A8S1HPJ6_9PELO|nr:unnamed protein product [Caenorhabditis auriculariae]